MECMWGGMGSDEWVSGRVLMSIIWVETCFFGIIEQAFNGKGILLNWLLRSIYKKWDFSRENFSGNQTWDRFPVELSISDTSQKNGV